MVVFMESNISDYFGNISPTNKYLNPYAAGG